MSESRIQLLGDVPEQPLSKQNRAIKFRVDCRPMLQCRTILLCFILLQLLTPAVLKSITSISLVNHASTSHTLATTINQTLASLDDEVYTGTFQSLQPTPIFDWITEKQGEIHVEFQKYIGVTESNTRLSPQYYKSSIFFPQTSQIKNDGASPGIMQQKYKVSLLFFNPQYVTEELLQIEFDITPSKLVDANASNQVSNGSVEKCIMLSSNEWGCNNTQMNYSKVWRRMKVDEDSLNYLSINYRMKVEPKDSTEKQYKISFQIEQSGPLVNVLHVRSKEPLVLRNRIGQFTIYCTFVILLILIQIISAHHINKSLTHHHMMATKFSLVTISYCTVADLSAAIDYAYQALDASGIYYRIFLFLPTAALIFLYFSYDIQILTRVLLAKFMNRNAGERVNVKKFLIIFYIGFFISYEGFVLLKAFFQYEWWLILLTSCFIFLPQVIKNARYGFGGDNGFNSWYVLGFLATRGLQTLYEHACPANYLKIKPFVWLATLLSVLMVLEMVLLYLQSKYGAIFFIPKFMRPGHYNYSRKLRLDGNEDNLECVICLHDLRESPAEEGANFNKSRAQEIKASMLSEIVIYRTPCGHIFHEECLKSWVQVKLECPTCRSKLPML